MSLLVGLLAFCATLLGGFLALRLRDKLHLILGFSAGAVVAVAFFDLMPEAIQLAGGSHPSSTIVSFVALGFLLYLLLDRLLLLHLHEHEGKKAAEESAEESRGNLRAGSLSLHSFLDGLGIGFSFQVSPMVGIIVAAAVLAHDFSDGINTISVVVRHGGDRKAAMRWLVADAVAPILGIIITFFFSISQDALGFLLALFAGFFLFIGASDLIPESQHEHPRFLTTLMTLIGAGVLYGAIRLAGL